MEGKMSENEMSAVAQDTDSTVVNGVSRPDADNQTPVGAQDTAKQVKPDGDWVKYDNYRKTLNEKSRWRERAELAEQERDDLKRKKLEETQNYRALYEEEKSRRERAEQEKAELHGVVTNGIKYQAVKQAIETRGLKCRDYEVLFQIGNTELLQTEDGEQVDGVDQFIEKSIEKYSYLFDKGAIPKTNDAQPSYQPSTVNKNNFLSLSYEEQQKQLAAANAAQQRSGVLTTNAPR